MAGKNASGVQPLLHSSSNLLYGFHDKMKFSESRFDINNFGDKPLSRLSNYNGLLIAILFLRTLAKTSGNLSSKDVLLSKLNSVLKQYHRLYEPFRGQIVRENNNNNNNNNKSNGSNNRSRNSNSNSNSNTNGNNNSNNNDKKMDENEKTKTFVGALFECESRLKAQALIQSEYYKRESKQVVYRRFCDFYMKSTKFQSIVNGEIENQKEKDHSFPNYDVCKYLDNNKQMNAYLKNKHRQVMHLVELYEKYETDDHVPKHEKEKLKKFFDKHNWRQLS